MKKNSLLCDIPPGQTAVVDYLNSDESIRRRLLDMGIIEGTKLECLFKSPFGDPTAFFVRGTVIALRKDVSKKIFVSV